MLLDPVAVVIGLLAEAVVEPTNHHLHRQVAAALVVHMREAEQEVPLRALQQVQQVHNQLVEVVVEQVEPAEQF